MGRTAEVFLRSPEGTLYTTAEAAPLLGKSVNAVRSGCVWPRTNYMGWEVVRRPAAVSCYMREDANRKKGPGYAGITLRELYEQYLWCRESPQMLTIMADFAGTADVTPMIRVFERWRREAIRNDEERSGRV